MGGYADADEVPGGTGPAVLKAITAAVATAVALPLLLILLVTASSSPPPAAPKARAADLAIHGAGQAAATAIEFAKAQLGKPYQWGAAGPDAYDCSGLVYAAYSAAGIRIARTTYQWRHDGPVIALSQIQPGDLLFSAGSDGTPSDPGHVVMYLGGGRVIQAPQTGEDVQIDPADLASVVVATRPAGLAATPLPTTRNPSPGGILMTRPPAPPLPKPPHPAITARVLAEAAHATAFTWARPLEPDRHSRAISQLYSTLRDLGIATRGLATYQTTGTPSASASQDFTGHVATSAQRLLDASERLSGVLAAEALRSVPDLEEPGAVLCRVARKAILSWRKPAGTAADREITIKRFITAVGFLSAATLGLATYAPRRRTIDLHAVGANLAEVTACLTAAIQVPEDAATGRDEEPDGQPDGGE